MFKGKTKILFGLIAIMYPIFVFCTLVVFKLPIRYLSIGLIVFGLAYSFVNSRHYRGRHTIALFVCPVILCSIGATSLFLGENPIIIKLYPAFTDISYLTIMGTSLIFPPPLAYYFINAIDKTLKIKIPEKIFNDCCFKATLAWCVFFVIDAIIATNIAFRGSDTAWAIYSGGITYLIMGLIFAGEFIIIKRIGKIYEGKQENENS